MHQEKHSPAELSVAEEIALRLDNDGQRFETETGQSLAYLIQSFRGERSARPGSTDVHRFRFRDDSVLIVAGDAWDLALCPLAQDCFCPEADGQHQTSCPHYE